MLPAPGFHHLHLNSVDPDAAIGFFLHVPFPSSELFRILPARRQLLEGPNPSGPVTGPRTREQFVEQRGLANAVDPKYTMGASILKKYLIS